MRNISYIAFFMVYQQLYYLRRDIMLDGIIRNSDNSYELLKPLKDGINNEYNKKSNKTSNR